MYNIAKKILYKAIAVTVVAAILFFLQANVNYADQEIPDAAEETDPQGQYGGTLILPPPTERAPLCWAIPLRQAIPWPL